jgi:ribonuclease Z
VGLGEGRCLHCGLPAAAFAVASKLLEAASLDARHSCLPRLAPATFELLASPVALPRSGRLYTERAVELGVPPGASFTDLKEGRSVELEDGRVVRPEDVLGPVRRGRWAGARLDRR